VESDIYWRDAKWELKPQINVQNIDNNKYRPYGRWVATDKCWKNKYRQKSVLIPVKNIDSLGWLQPVMK
jgi:hypothetical protein